MRTLYKNISQLVTWNTELQSMFSKDLTNVITEDEIIVYVGDFNNSRIDKIVDCSGKVMTAGLVDPHTHPIFYKTREQEFEMRILGKSYMDIADAGGGIRNSVRALRQVSEDELFDICLERMHKFTDYGTTTIEAKSGYGLSFKDEVKSLQVIRRLNKTCALDLVPTFLGAHEIPDEFQSNRSGYIEILCKEMIPYIAENSLAEYCDVFTEKNVYTLGETEKIFKTALDHGLKLRIHSDEFENLGGTELAVNMGASSADHLLVVSDKGIKSLAESKTVATVLPGTAFFLGHKDYAPARKLWDSGTTVALATDFNPGSSMTQNMQLIMSLACTQMKLTPMEALQAATINSSSAIDRDRKLGSIEPGKQADIILWDVKNYHMIPYWYGMNHVWKVIKKGIEVQ